MSEIANYFLYRNAEGETGLSANSIDDLNLDDLFAEIDYCHSSIGRQYLYYLLLSDKTSGMEKQEALLSSLATHTGLRTLLSNTLKELDKPDAYSIVSILENDNTGIGAKEMVLINICRFLPLLFLAPRGVCGRQNFSSVEGEGDGYPQCLPLHRFSGFYFVCCHLEGGATLLLSAGR